MSYAQVSTFVEGAMLPISRSPLKPTAFPRRAGLGIQARSFAVRWSSLLTPPAAGEYRLGIRLGKCYACSYLLSYRMFLDDKLLLDSEHLPPGAEPENASIPVQFTIRKTTTSEWSTPNAEKVGRWTSSGKHLRQCC